jgi:hypothetical protein
VECDANLAGSKEAEFNAPSLYVQAIIASSGPLFSFRFGCVVAVQ